MMTDIKKLNDHNLDEKVDATTGNLVEMLEEQVERMTVKLAMRKALLEKLKAMER